MSRSILAPVVAGITLAAVSALLMLPSLVFGVNGTDNAHLNDVWAHQVAALMAAGDPYPRWLPDSFGGLGSPAFIFYPPLAFLLDGVVRLSVGDGMAVPYRLAVTAWLLLWASGATMHVWLRAQVRPGLALLGALLYMAAPYHLMDHYWRGALAEFAAYAAIPLVLLGVRQATAAWRGVALLGPGYALLILAHLPTALLMTFFLLPAYAITAAINMPKPAAALCRCAVGGAAGLALSAIYLLPAVALLGHVSSGIFWQDPFYDPNRWVLLALFYVSAPTSMWIIMSIASSYLALAVALWTSGERLWCGIAIAGLLALSGAIPMLWSVPLLATVQFPFRLLSVIEASVITGLVLTLSRTPHWGAGRLLTGIAALALLPGLWLFCTITAANVAGSAGYWARLGPIIEAHMMDGPEYLPAGFPADKMDSVAGPGPWTAPAALGTTCPGAVCVARRQGQTIEVTVSAACDVTLAEFAFPGWVATADGVQLSLGESQDWHFLQFRTPPGAQIIRLRRVWTGAEWAGAMISGAALLAWLLILLAPMRSDPQRRA